VELFKDQDKLTSIRKQMMELDFSWETSVKQYIDLYSGL